MWVIVSPMGGEIKVPPLTGNVIKLAKFYACLALTPTLSQREREQNSPPFGLTITHMLFLGGEGAK